MSTLPIPLEYLDDTDRDVYEREVLVRARAYEDLRAREGFIFLRQFLDRYRQTALSALRENGDPAQETTLLVRWREREALMTAIEHELDSTIEMAKEIKNARREET